MLHRAGTLDVGVGEVRATAYHPFWVVEGEDLENRPALRHVDVSEDRGESLPGRWVNSHELREGDVVFLRGRGPVTVRRVRQQDERTPVCNLTVVGLHTFAVGEAQVLVHNTSGSFAPLTAAQREITASLQRLQALRNRLARAEELSQRATQGSYSQTVRQMAADAYNNILRQIEMEQAWFDFLSGGLP